MSLFKRVLGLVLASTLAISSTFIQVPVLANSLEYSLPADVEFKKGAFDSLAGLTEKYTTVFVEQVNNQEKRIQDITFYDNQLAVNGEVTIAIPEDIAKVIHFFGRVDIFGTGLSHLEVNVETPYGTNALSEPWRGDGNIQGRPRSFAVDFMDLDDNSFKGWKLKIKGSGATINRLRLFEQNGLPVSYDITAYTVLGSDKPILDTTVSIDATKRLSIEGITEYENEKFKTLYANPLGEADGYIIADEYVDLDFNPGRQMLKFYEGFELAYGSATAPKMVESAVDGYADYSYFANNYGRSESDIATFDRLYDSDLDYTICYDNWPTWNWREGATGDGHRGTPDIKYFAAAYYE